MQRDFNRVWSRVDCIFTPSAPIPAPPIGATSIQIDGEDEDVRLASTRFVRAFNVLGVPAISIPCAITTDGLPLSLQIVCKAFEEKLLLRIAAAMEASLGLGELLAPPQAVYDFRA